MECAEGGRDEDRLHSRRPSAVPPRSVFLPPYSSASQAEARGPAASRAAMAEEEAFRLAGARAGSVLGVAKALQRQQPERDDEGVCGGVCGGVSGLRRWRMAIGR